MLLGKRSRPVMRRTTSMSMLDLGSAAQHRDKLKVCGVNPGRSSGSASDKDGAQGGGFVEQSMMMVQPVCTNNGLDNGAFLIPHGSPLNAPPVATAAVAAAAATTTFCGWNFNAAQQQQHHRRFKSEPAHFLQVCFLCKRRLAGRDIYMYRGENAFCSIECRQQQIILDERTEKATNAKDTSTNQKNQKGSRQKPRAESLAAAA